jgi:chromate transporter
MNITRLEMEYTKPSFREALKYWIYLGFINFGGPAGQISIMHRDIVEKRKWISERRFMHALNYCMLLPGPEAQQLAVYIGWILHKTPGGIAAGIFFIIPGFFTILVLSILYVTYGDVAWITGIFHGLRPAVTAIIAFAMIRIAARALTSYTYYAITVAAFVGLYILRIPFPLIILCAGLAGLLGHIYRPSLFTSDKRSATDPVSIDDDESTVRVPPRRSFRSILIWSILWLGPVALLYVILGWEHVFSKLGIFFGTAAIVTFGGAYSVLAFMAQAAVEWYGWMQPGQMLDGLALAETTPGPLIQVTQFVGFLAAYNYAGTMPPITAGILASIFVTWVTFTPSFLWIFAGAPYIEFLRGNKTIDTALTAVTASVVGVILSLAVWFASSTLFGNTVLIEFGFVGFSLPDPETIRVIPFLLAVSCFILLKIYSAKIHTVILFSVVVALILSFLFPDWY